MAAREKPDWAEADGEGEDQVRGYLGPYPVLQGTLTAAMKEDIYDQTGCSVNVRGRQQWEHRCLTIVGPPSRLVTAKKLAETAIASTVRADGVRADGSVSKTAARAEKGSGKGPVPAPKTPPKATPPPASKVKTETEPQEAAPGPKAAAKAYPAELKQAAPPPKAAAKAEPAPKEAAPRPRAAAKAQPHEGRAEAAAAAAGGMAIAACGGGKLLGPGPGASVPVERRYASDLDFGAKHVAGAADPRAARDGPCSPSKQRSCLRGSPGATGA